MITEEREIVGISQVITKSTWIGLEWVWQALNLEKGLS